MALTRNYAKHIFCLEGNWYPDLRKQSSILPLLRFLEETSKVQYVHRHCITHEQLKLYLKKYQQRRYEQFDLCYLAFHGDPGLIYLEKKKLYLDELADLAGNAFKNRIVHFGSCKTLGMKEPELLEFLHKTGAKALIGYKKDVDFIPGSALDLLLFEEMQYYRDMAAVKRKIMKKYGSLILDQGLIFIHR